MELIRGKAEFTGARQVAVDGTTYTADHIIIATGGHPTLLDIPGEPRQDGVCVLCTTVASAEWTGSGHVYARCLRGCLSNRAGKELMITSDGFFELEELPK